MFLYNLHKKEYFCASKFLKTDDLFSCATSKKIRMKHICEYGNQQTKLSRVMKFINRGFTIDNTMENIISFFKIFVDSFFLPIEEERIDFGKCIEIYRRRNICTCTPKDSKFVTECLNDKTYQFVKNLYFLCKKIRQIWNTTIDKMLAYALYMKDYEFAKSVLSEYNCWTSRKISLMYIPTLLRQSKNFDLTTHFLDFFKKSKLLNISVTSSCCYPYTALYESFIFDAIYAEDMEYYEKLVEYDSIFSIPAINQLKIPVEYADTLTDEECVAAIIPGNVVSGAIFNRYLKIKGLKLYKFVNSTYKHQNHTYTHGRNKDKIPFFPIGECGSGGLYFSDQYNISNYAGCGEKLYSIKIYPRSRVHIQNHKYKTDQFYIDLESPISLEDFLIDNTDLLTGLNISRCINILNMINFQKISEKLFYAITEHFEVAEYLYKIVRTIVSTHKYMGHSKICEMYNDNPILCKLIIKYSSLDTLNTEDLKIIDALKTTQLTWTEEQIFDTYKELPDEKISQLIPNIFLTEAFIESVSLHKSKDPA